METTKYAASAGVRFAVAAGAASHAAEAAFVPPTGTGPLARPRTAPTAVWMQGSSVPAPSDEAIVFARKDGFGNVPGLPPWSPPVR